MATIESLDYVHVDNEGYRMYEKKRKKRSRIWDNVYRWILVGIIGVATGAAAYVIHYMVTLLYSWKFTLVKDQLPVSLNKGFSIFVLFNGILVLIGSIAVFFEPAAAGSGLPEVKGYLNGVRVPRAFNFRNLMATMISVTAAVSSSLPVGPEGPMIHIGGMIGGGIGEMRSRTLGCSFPFLPRFQNSRDRRDFISCGAACGVAAAFGAPIGGVLFALEEASSFWSQKLTWRTFFGTMIAVLTVNLGFSKFTGVLNMKVDILFDITSMSESYNVLVVILPCIILGIIGGLSGGIFTYLNLKVNKVRSQSVNRVRWLRIVEILMIAITFSFILLYIPSLFGCKPMPADSSGDSGDEAYFVNSFTCPDGQYNDMATLCLAPQEQSVSHLLGVENLMFDMSTLLAFCGIYYVGSLITAGCGMSTGLFVPMMLIGASYGRALGHVLIGWHPAKIDMRVYGLIGAASFMSGVTRMTISLAVILIEVTNDIQFLVPVILTIMISKAVGDYITFPLYDAQLQQKSLPFLESEPLDVMETMTCDDIMAKDVVCFNAIEKVAVLLQALKMTNHNGFPVVALGDTGDLKFKGLILRKHILLLIKNKLYSSHQSNKNIRLSHLQFQELINGPRISIADIKLSEVDLSAEVECWYYMNRSAIIVHPEMNLAMAFRLFRTMGLRHLPVVSDQNCVVGIITRKNLLHEVCELKHEEIEEDERHGEPEGEEEEE